jgi:phosphoribosyl 1,2-cyclic phosphodiesterase
LTHAHADALLGLDDLRHWTMHGVIQKHVDVYCDDATLESVAMTFPYLVDQKKATGGGAVSHLNFHKFEHSDEVDIDGVSFIPLLVEHGLVGGKLYGTKPYMALAYRFEDIVYMSDVSSVPATTMQLMHGVKLLIIDALHPVGQYTSHFCLEDALRIVRYLKPKYVYFTNLSHLWDHDIGNKKLEEIKEADPSLHGIHMELAYDGLRLVFKS